MFAVGDRRLSRDGTWLAAVLAKGPRAALSHDSAAVSWEMSRDGALPPHVSLPGRGGHGNDMRLGFVVHRPAALRPAAVVTHRGIPTTTPERTLVDLTATRNDDQMLALVGEAARRRVVALPTLHGQLVAALEAKPRSKSLCRLRNLLRTHAPELHLSESELERRFMTLCARRGIDLPGQQVWIGRARVDFRWEAERLIVEVDGHETHGTIAAMSADYARQRRLTLERWMVLRFTWADVVHDPDRTTADIRAALAQARG